LTSAVRAWPIADVLDDKGVDGQTHIAQIVGRDLLHLLGKGVAVFVDLLYCQCAQDGSQVACQGLVRHMLDLVLAF
jgi:hypothetical protein